MATSESQPKRNLRKAYSVAAGAVVAGAAANADAAIVYSGVQDISIGQYSSQNLNLDGDAYNDILLKNYVFFGGNYQGAAVNYAPGVLVGFNAGLNYVSALSEGKLVGPSTDSSFFAGSMAYGANNVNAEFNDVDNAYIGLAFPIAGANHYGWIRVSVDNAAGEFTIHDWAYNDVPGAAIGTGQVPEPSTLALLAAGATGVAAMRRRRKSA